MIEKSQSSIVLLKRSKVSQWRSVKDLIWVALQSFNYFFESLHLIRVIIQLILRMTLQQWIADMKNMVWLGTSTQDIQSEEIQESTMPRLTRLKRISQLLETSIYSKNQQQQICMFYSVLIDLYPNSKCTKDHPQYLYEPDVYIPLVNFRTILKIKTAKVHCDLELSIIFQENLCNNMPSFYIKNPDYNQYKPRLNCVDSGNLRNEKNYFEAVFGGLKVRVPKLFKDRWEWSAQSFYKEQNVANMVKWLHLFLLPQFFPFSKRKQPISTSIFTKSVELKQFLEKKALFRSRNNDLQEPPLLENIQSLNSLSISIQSQINFLKDEIEGMKEFIKASQSFEIQQFMPTIKDKKSQIILDAISGIQASKDVQNKIQKQYMSGLITYQQFKQGIMEVQNRRFESMHLLSYWKSPQLLW